MSESFINRVRERLATCPRQVLVLGGLVLVLIGLMAFQSLRGGPSLAAGGAAAVRAVTAQLSGTSAEKGVPSHVSMDRLIAWASKPRADVHRDLFRLDVAAFMRDSTVVVETAQKSEGGFWRRLDKSVAVAADEEARRAELAEEHARRAATLRLQTTLMGSRPRASIDGKLLGEGDIVAAGAGPDRTEFRVLHIEARRVILERDGIRFELRMAH